MKLIYSDSPLPNEISGGIFLAGPSPREKSVVDWRLEAVRLLKELDFKGEVYLPIPEKRFWGGEDDASWTYDNQIQWECDAREMADVILFWIPRELKTMPGFTTNVEFGEDLSSGKMMYGRPAGAEKCRYLDKRVEGIGLVVHDDLEALLKATIQRIGSGAVRHGGEVDVPLFIWNTLHFQSWYKSLKLAGNRLDGARLLHHFCLPGGAVLSFTLSVKVWVEAESTWKENEFIISQPDISVVVAYYKPNPDQGRAKVVLIREFRSTVNNDYGYVWELPGGSSVDESDSRKVAHQELMEETGISIDDLTRFEYLGAAQLAATVSTHKAHLYSVQLTESEYQAVAALDEKNVALGNTAEGERTTVHLVDAEDLDQFSLDFSMIGMISCALK